MSVPHRCCYLLMPQHLLNYCDIPRGVKEPRSGGVPQHMEHEVGVILQTHLLLDPQPCSSEGAEFDLERHVLVHQFLGPGGQWHGPCLLGLGLPEPQVVPINLLTLHGPEFIPAHPRVNQEFTERGIAGIDPSHQSQELSLLILGQPPDPLVVLRLPAELRQLGYPLSVIPELQQGMEVGQLPVDRGVLHPMSQYLDVVIDVLSLDLVEHRVTQDIHSITEIADSGTVVALALPDSVSCYANKILEGHRDSLGLLEAGAGAPVEWFSHVDSYRLLTVRF